MCAAANPAIAPRFQSTPPVAGSLTFAFANLRNFYRAINVKFLILGFVFCVGVGVAGFRLRQSRFEDQWKLVQIGMTPFGVKKALGDPEESIKLEIIGSGNEKVTSWRYFCSDQIYAVDFDNVGPSGISVVFRTAVSLKRRPKPFWMYVPPWSARARVGC